MNLLTLTTRRLAALSALLLITAAAVAGVWAPQPEKSDRVIVIDPPIPAKQQLRFLAYDILIDSGAEPLSVYQVEIKDTKGHARIVGIEGGEPGAYNDAPHYDPKAIQGDHVIIGGFTTADAPTGKVRVARLHVMAEGTPQFTTAITTAAQGGRKFNATLTVQPAAKP